MPKGGQGSGCKLMKGKRRIIRMANGARERQVEGIILGNGKGKGCVPLSSLVGLVVCLPDVDGVISVLSELNYFAKVG